MKHNRQLKLVAAAALLLAMALTACNVSLNTITGSGNVVSQEYDFTNFDEIDISHAFTATITQGDAYGVTVRVDDNLVEKLRVSQEGNRVSIGLEPGTIATRATLEVDITTPRLSWLGGSGASQIQINNPFVTGDNFTANLSGASQLHGDLDAIDLELEASGASTIFLAGAGANVRAVASGASTIDLNELTAVDAQVDASGASNVTVNVDGILDAKASGGSNVHYLGDPEMGEVDTSGGSNVGPR